MQNKDPKITKAMVNREVVHAKTVVRSIFFALVGIAILVASFFWEQNTENMLVAVSGEVEFVEDTLFIPDNAYIVAEEGEIAELLTLEEKDGAYLISMENEGRIWGNFGNSFSLVNISVEGKLVVVPTFSYFDLEYKGGVVTLNSYMGNTYVGFLVGGFDQFEYMNEYSKSFGNIQLVPSGARVKIPLSRVDERISKLLPFKLIKEVGYSFISSKSYEDDFVRENLKKSFKFSEDLKEVKREDFYDSAPAGVSSALSDLLRENLIMFESKEEEFYMTKLDKHLYEAVSSYDSDVVKASLKAFSADYDKIPSDLVENGFGKQFVLRWLSDLVVFESVDSEYKVFESVLDNAVDLFELPYLLSVRLSRYNVGLYEEEDVDDIYRAYYKGIEKLFGYTDDVVQYKRFLSFYNQVLDMLLLQHSDIYTKEAFTMKRALENELYSLYYGGELKEEAKQSFVRRKIDFLKKLKRFFFEEEVGLSEARSVISILVEDLDDYMPTRTSENAVIGLFERELTDIGNFWGYINDIEYSKSSLYGSSHKERYAVYLEEKDQVLSILDVQRDVLGDVVQSMSPSEVALDIRAKLEGVGAKNVRVEMPASVTQRYIRVAAVLGGHVFDAEYDRDYGTVKNVYAYGSLLSGASVKLTALEEFLFGSLVDVVEDTNISIDEEASMETNAQKIAKSIIAKKLVEAGFGVDMEDVEVIDPVNAVYRVNDVLVEEEGEAVTISFDYLANEASVENLFILKEGEGVNISGEFPLDDLRRLVLSGKY
ncbi:hypothetical protein HOE67_01715 [Candidatus Peregrinibacteria bacterium]|jgi:hypothetical protein|nr:hypothetical protein [Candidatus Peregrinibacteria bacterium]MBT4055804.1 hypothetical protein [Candidatus Peregrinibacteria bacterium]